MNLSFSTHPAMGMSFHHKFFHTWCLLLISGFIITCTLKKEKPETYPIGHIKTQKGEILIWLYDQTPQHKKSFIQLAQDGYWDSLTFNRVIPGFVIQGGCPDTPEGFTDSSYLLPPEWNDSLTHTYGAVGAGRDNNPKKYSARCQFYIVQNKEGTHRLDGRYMIFGKVIKGMDVVEAIAVVARDSTDRPRIPVKLDVDILFMDQNELNALGFDKDKIDKTE